MFGSRVWLLNCILTPTVRLRGSGDSDCTLGAICLSKERTLREQISDANDSILANFSEGFEQPRIGRLPIFCSAPKDQPREVFACLREAPLKNCITNEELDFQLGVGDEVCRLLPAWRGN